jgi:hypothetical protein
MMGIKGQKMRATAWLAPFVSKYAQVSVPGKPGTMGVAQEVEFARRMIMVGVARPGRLGSLYRFL